NQNTVFTIDTGTQVSITGLTIEDGNAGNNYGGGINNNGTLTVTNCTLLDNSSGWGGGGIFNGSTLIVSNSTLSGNSASPGGGIENLGKLTVSNSTLSGNSGDGGGIENLDFDTGAALVVNCTLAGNSASFGGGILNYATLTVRDSTISGNTASGSYG